MERHNDHGLSERRLPLLEPHDSDRELLIGDKQLRVQLGLLPIAPAHNVPPCIQLYSWMLLVAWRDVSIPRRGAHIPRTRQLHVPASSAAILPTAAAATAAIARQAAARGATATSARAVAAATFRAALPARLLPGRDWREPRRDRNRRQDGRRDCLGARLGDRRRYRLGGCDSEALDAWALTAHWNGCSRRSRLGAEQRVRGEGRWMLCDHRQPPASAQCKWPPASEHGGDLCCVSACWRDGEPQRERIRGE